jgi:hypothetical protein
MPFEHFEPLTFTTGKAVTFPNFESFRGVGGQTTVSQAAALNRCAPQEGSASMRTPVVPLRAPGNSFYRPELDVLRFFAFYGVFRFHFAPAVSRYVAEGSRGGWDWQTASRTPVVPGSICSSCLARTSSPNYFSGKNPMRHARRARILHPSHAAYLALYFFCIGLALVPALNPVHGFSWHYVTCFPPARRKLEHSRVGMADSYHC